MNIAYLTNSEFHALIRVLKRNGVVYPSDNMYAFTVIMDRGSLIVYNKDSGIDNDLKQIVLQHENAHLHGILDEWALGRLNKKRRKILIDQWKERHGHDYVPEV
jgi:hypothetical protein